MLSIVVVKNNTRKIKFFALKNPCFGHKNNFFEHGKYKCLFADIETVRIIHRYNCEALFGLVVLEFPFWSPFFKFLGGTFLRRQFFVSFSKNKVVDYEFGIFRRIFVNALYGVRIVEYYKSGSLTIVVDPNCVIFLMSVLKFCVFFDYASLTDMWMVDFPARFKRFEITYSLLSFSREKRFYIKMYLTEWNTLHSLVNLYGSAPWLEREVWDMYGIAFSGHPDLRRILTDYGFLGFPLRKDFPLTGFYELRYDDTSRRISFSCLGLSQELRFFSFSSPWDRRHFNK